MSERLLVSLRTAPKSAYNRQMSETIITVREDVSEGVVRRKLTVVDGDLVLARHLWLVVDCPVEGAKALWSGE